MGACLSCIRPDTDDDLVDHHERTPLLAGAGLKPDEFDDLVRREELEEIVATLTENLIDVTTFLVDEEDEEGGDYTQDTSTLEVAAVKPTPNGHGLGLDEDELLELEEDPVPHPSVRLSPLQRQALLDLGRQVDEVLSRDVITPTGPLVLNLLAVA